MKGHGTDTNKPYTQGLTISHLSDEELEHYRNLKRPIKYKDISTLAPQQIKKNTIVSTSTQHPYKNLVSTR